MTNYVCYVYLPDSICKQVSFVETAMVHRDSQSEVTSVLISDLYGRVITGKDIQKGFEILNIIQNMPEICFKYCDAQKIFPE